MRRHFWSFPLKCKNRYFETFFQELDKSGKQTVNFASRFETGTATSRSREPVDPLGGLSRPPPSLPNRDVQFPVKLSPGRPDPVNPLHAGHRDLGCDRDLGPWRSHVQGHPVCGKRDHYRLHPHADLRGLDPVELTQEPLAAAGAIYRKDK